MSSTRERYAQKVVKEIVEGLLPGAPDEDGNPATYWFGIPHAGVYALAFLLVLFAVLQYVKSVVEGGSGGEGPGLAYTMSMISFHKGNPP